MFEKLKAGLSGLIDKIMSVELKIEYLQSIFDDFKLSLIESDVAFPVVESICDSLISRLKFRRVRRLEDKEEIVREALREALLDILSVKDEVNLLEAIESKKRRGEPFVTLFVGINGTGKTTTIAKVAKMLMKRGYSIVLACSDTHRAGSIEQLEEHARRLRVRMIKHKYGSDPAAVAYDAIEHARAHGVNVVLIDTAGRIQTDYNLMEELRKIKRVIEPDLTILIVDALTGNDAVNQAEEFQKFVGIDGAVLTKVDADAKGGAALSVAYVTKKPILYIGVGPNYEDLEEFDPKRFISRLSL